MNDDIIKILCDPETGGPLQLTGSDGRAGRKSGCILNPVTGRHYGISNGIPMLLKKEMVFGSNRKYQKFYDKIAFAYDLVNRIYYMLRHGLNYGSEEAHRKYLLEEIGIDPGDKVLEVALGPGSNLRFLPKDAEYYGIDISLGMLNTCRRNAEKWNFDVQLIQAMAEYLPFRDKIFDVVYHIGGFNYFNDRQRAISEMIRVSKPGARIIIIDETVESEEAAYRKVPVINKVYSKRENTFSLPLDLIPENMEEVKVKEIYSGVLYSLSFKVPGREQGNHSISKIQE